MGKVGDEAGDAGPDQRFHLGFVVDRPDIDLNAGLAEPADLFGRDNFIIRVKGLTIQFGDQFERVGVGPVEQRGGGQGRVQCLACCRKG